MKKLIRRIFKYETMDGGGTCPVYLERWELLNLFGYEVYLHHFLGDDWARDPHDHPRRFISIGLWGRYMEEVTTIHAGGQSTTTHIFKAPWLRSFPAEHIHRISLVDGKKAWTLVIVLHKTREWGFWNLSGKWVQWKEYVYSGKSRKSC